MRPHPSHTTVHTGPYTAVRRVELTANRQSRKSQPVEVSVGQRNSERRAAGEPPRTISAARRSRGQVATHSPLRQLPKSYPPSLPLLPHRGSQPASDPPLKTCRHARRVALPVIAKPTPHIAGQLLDHSFRAHPARPARQLPHPPRADINPNRGSAASIAARRLMGGFRNGQAWRPAPLHATAIG